MLKLVYALRIIAAVLAVGAMGSLQLDVIDFWTWFCQTMLGVTLWILAGYWLEDIHELEKEKVRWRKVRRNFSGLGRVMI